MSAKPKVVVIAGPTGVGKSNLAMRLAQATAGEIVSADSVQVYRYLDVGANKPSLADKQRVVHHLVDICDPREIDFSAGDYFTAARQVTKDVSENNTLPIVVGGTMMYLRWYIYGKPATPEADPVVARQVREELDRLDGDWDKAIQLLSQVDASRADKLSRNDWYRLGRALEVARTAGVGVTALPLTGGAPGSDMETKTESGSQLDFDFRCFFLCGPREEVYRRIDTRCELMIVDKGLLDEVAELLLKDRLRPDSSAGRAIGYRQTMDYFRALDGTLADDGAGADESSPPSNDELKAFRDYLNGFMSASRQYARQQIKWFRSEPLFHFVPSTGASDTPLDTVLRVTEMSSEEYTRFVQSGSDADARAQTYAEAKALKLYISKPTKLAAGSNTERETVRHARDLARALRAAGKIAETAAATAGE